MAALTDLKVISNGKAGLPFSPMVPWLIGCATIGAAVIGFGGYLNGGIRTDAVSDTIAVALGPILGCIFGIGAVRYTDNVISTKCKVSRNNLDEITNLNTKEGIFILFTAALLTIYAVAFFFAVHSLGKDQPPDVWPVKLGIAAVMGVTLGFLQYFSVRYGAYVRMTCFLESAVKKSAPDTVREAFHRAVFKGEQFYEPPGNVFVSVGITATFLGLALGLVTLNIVAILQPGGEESNQLAQAIGQVEAGETKAAVPNVAVALNSFIGCMGLALGVSMLGVMTAMAAQSLRGHGASLPTEDLLKRAMEPSLPADPGTPDPLEEQQPNGKAQKTKAAPGPAPAGSRRAAKQPSRSGKR